jgi:hypothetical protein
MAAPRTPIGLNSYFQKLDLLLQLSQTLHRMQAPEGVAQNVDFAQKLSCTVAMPKVDPMSLPGLPLRILSACSLRMSSAVLLCVRSSITVVVTFLLIPFVQPSDDDAPLPRNLSSSESLLTRPPVIVVVVTAFLEPGPSMFSDWPRWWLPVLRVLLHGSPEDCGFDPNDAMVDFMSGRRVAMHAAVMPTPTSTVVQIAKSVVRQRKSPLYPCSVQVYGRRTMVAVEPLFALRQNQTSKKTRER